MKITRRIARNRPTAFFGQRAPYPAGRQVAMPFLPIPFSLIFVHNRLIYIEIFRFIFTDLFIPKIYKSYMLYDPALLFVVRLPPAARRPHTHTISTTPITVVVARAVLEQTNPSFFTSCTRRRIVLEIYIIFMPLFTLSGVRFISCDGVQPRRRRCVVTADPRRRRCVVTVDPRRRRCVVTVDREDDAAS
jgi:hypothetical protein